MNTVVKEIGLGNLAERFHGEDPNEWVMVNLTEMRCIKHSKRIAEILINNGDIHITIPDCFDLIRREHQSDFEPHHHGLTVQTAYNFMGEKIHPDIHASWRLPEDIPTEGERVYIPATTYKYRPKCKGSL